MSRVTELEKALTTLFRKGTEVGYTETEIDEFLENIDYHALLQAVWNKAETVYAYRADGKNALSLDYAYILLEAEAGKSLSFDSKTEDILNDNNEVCGQRITLYNLQYHNNFSKNAGSMSWGYPLNAENQYIEVIVELEDDTLQISSAK